MDKIEIFKKDFLFYADDSMWLASLNEVGFEATFEIYHKELNVPLIKKILSFLVSEKYPSFESKSLDLLSNLSSIFWGNDVIHPSFSFSGIVLKDFKRAVDFQIIFQMNSKASDFCDFANWVIEVTDFKVIGVFREQL